MVSISVVRPAGPVRRVERGASSSFFLERPGTARVEMVAELDAFDCAGHPTSADTDDPGTGETAARCLHDLGVAVETGERARVLELRLDVGDRAVVIGTLQGSEAHGAAASLASPRAAW